MVINRMFIAIVIMLFLMIKMLLLSFSELLVLSSNTGDRFVMTGKGGEASKFKLEREIKFNKHSRIKIDG